MALVPYHVHSPRKGILSHLFSSAKSQSSLSVSSSSTPSSPLHHTLSNSMMEENIQNAESIITKWDPNSSSYTKVTSLFQHSRKEAKDFLKSVKDLRRAMHFLVSEHSASASDMLVLAQNLMQIAMKRLEKEFYLILSANRDQLDPDSVSSRSSDWSSNFDDEDEGGSEDELKMAADSISEVERVSAPTMSDLKSMADCMISSGYGKECVQIYKLIRTSIVEEGLYQLGIEWFKPSHIHKMNWEALEHVIKNWLNAIGIAVKTLFRGEKILSDHVFSVSNTIRESCFSDITKGALNLLKFPELITKHKKSPEHIFKLMELYEALSNFWPEIELMFHCESTSAVKFQTLTSLHKLADAVHSLLSDFESTIQKYSSKTQVTGGGIHPLTLSGMSYICSLAEYSGVLTDIFADYPSSEHSPLRQPHVESPTSDNGSSGAVTKLLSWLILALLCKLDSKAELYKDVSLSYLFLANNLHFIIQKVRTSHLKDILGDEWVFSHAKKVKQYALSYEQMAWNKVFSSFSEKPLSNISLEMAMECFRSFNTTFEEAYVKQTSWIVPDRHLRDELKVSIAKKLVPAYREFYHTYWVTLRGEKNLEVLVRFGPDDIENYLSDLFQGSPISGSSSFSSSSSHSPKSIP